MLLWIERVIRPFVLVTDTDNSAGIAYLDILDPLNRVIVSLQIRLAELILTLRLCMLGAAITKMLLWDLINLLKLKLGVLHVLPIKKWLLLSDKVLLNHLIG